MPTPEEKIRELVALKREICQRQMRDVCNDLEESYEVFVEQQRSNYACMKAEGIHAAEDQQERDFIEAVADFFQIDFDTLRKLGIEDFDVLADAYFVEEDPKKISAQFPTSLELDQAATDFLARFQKANSKPGGMEEFMREEKKRRERRRQEMRQEKKDPPLLPPDSSR